MRRRRYRARPYRPARPEPSAPAARPGDTLARLGGDEFVVLLDGLAAAEEAEALAARLGATLESPFALDGQEAAITTSIGVALAESGRTTPTELLRDADVALYQAKERGKASYAVYDPGMGDSLRERVALETDLRRALERDELELHYQPIVELVTGRIVSVEALARWNHPMRGLMPPDAFIPLAEETGLIGLLGQWVLAEACRQGRTWQEQEPAVPVVISVNLSARQFQSPRLVEEVERVLRMTGLMPERLKLELTESAVMADPEAAVATLGQLKGLGVGLAIDDFGTGYSSLAYLRRLPVDSLKVDKRFVAGLGRDNGDTAIVEAVVGLARTLGLGVVAEGVETAAHVAHLRELGCAFGQGYHFGPPQPVAAVESLLTKVTYAVGPRVRRAS